MYNNKKITNIIGNDTQTQAILNQIVPNISQVRDEVLKITKNKTVDQIRSDLGISSEGTQEKETNE